MHLTNQIELKQLVIVLLFIDDGLVIPKGSGFFSSLMVLFRDPEFFPKPLQFNPDRFIDGNLNDEEATKFHRFAYIPFSAGKRNCIGQKYAMLELKCVLSNVLRHFEMLPLGEEPDVCTEIVLRTKNGVQLGMKARSYD